MVVSRRSWAWVPSAPSRACSKRSLGHLRTWIFSNSTKHSLLSRWL
ncbi:unnamed protein product [Dibothriocephalus latus]|uniref:Uncharacterized protein n=1 Tax=Dibothriocephalus latus TaxID=60516 RepID=A0A3P6QJ72_DIBLA|nr:unnamed protein product [Dibothriocephalus latus]